MLPFNNTHTHTHTHTHIYIYIYIYLKSNCSSFGSLAVVLVKGKISFCGLRIWFISGLKWEPSAQLSLLTRCMNFHAHLVKKHLFKQTYLCV